MARALFLAGHDLVIVDATNSTRVRRDFWRPSGPTQHPTKEHPGLWRLEFKLFDVSAEECIRRARAAHDEEIVSVIQRMAANWEPLGPDEIQTPVEAISR